MVYVATFIAITVLNSFKADIGKPPLLLRSYSLIHAIELMARENERRLPYMDGNNIIKGIGLLLNYSPPVQCLFAMAYNITANIQ